MSQIVEFDISGFCPEPDEVYRSQGIEEGTVVSDTIRGLCSVAIDLFTASSRPVGIISELSIEEFGAVFRGEEKNEAGNPLEFIFPRADSLALFVLTLGHEISTKIEDYFDGREFALGAILDSVASLAADKTVQVLENDVQKDLLEREMIGNKSIVLSYSPGYCGWHISGQKKLFEYLDPGRIRVTVNDTFLMSPLKSVSGVLVAGEREIHLFENNFPFCRQCKTRTCQLRMGKLQEL